MSNNAYDRTVFPACLKGMRESSILLLMAIFFGGQISQGASSPEIVLSKTNLEILEGSEEVIEMTLSRKPSDPVEVSWSHGSELLRVYEVNRQEGNVTFSDSGNSWKKPKYFRVHAKGNTKIGDISTTLTATAKSRDKDFDGLMTLVNLKILDDDGVMMKITPKQVLLTEVGEAKTFEVKLSKVPDKELTVLISSNDPGAVKVSPAKLTFEMGLAQSVSKTSSGSILGYHETNYPFSREVTVTPVIDTDINNETVTIQLEGSEKILSNPKESVMVEVYDDDQDYLVLSKTKLTIDEGGSESFQIKLSRRPVDSVRVGLSTSNDTLSVGGRRVLTFTRANWDINQTVRVRASQDDDSNDENEEVSFKVSGGVHDGVEQKMGVQIRDDDSPGLVLSSSWMTVPEGGEKTFTVRLATRPTADVRLTLGQPENGDIKANAGFSDDQNTLIFTLDNWNRVQQVTVSAASDADAADDFGSIPISSEGGEYLGVRGSIQVRVIEDERADFALHPGVLSLIEGGPSKSFTVALTSEPTKRVRVELNNSDRTAVRVKPRRLVFGPSDWSEKQTVTVSPMPDDDTEDEQARVDLTASGAEYSDVKANVLIRVKDSDSHGGEAEKPDRDPNKGGADKQIQVTEAPPSIDEIKEMQPNFPEQRQILPDDEGGRRLLDRSTVPGVLTVHPIPEERRQVIVRNVGFIITLAEDCDDWILTVKLVSKPTDLVEVELNSSIPGMVLIDPIRLVFTPSNWSEVQMVAIRPVEDLARNAEQVYIRLKASGAAEYENISASVLVQLEDEKCDACPNPILEQILCVLWVLAWLLFILVLLILIQTVKQFFPREK